MRFYKLAIFCVLLPVCQGQVPLNDLGPGTYQGFPGGLYEGGNNFAPGDHDLAGIAAGQTVQLIGGKVGVLSIGMSNASYEWCNGSKRCAPGTFVSQARADSRVANNAIVFVDGAIYGQPVQSWTSPSSQNWSTVASRLASAGLTQSQVQVVWHKNAWKDPQSLPTLPASGSAASVYEQALGQVFRNMRARYPNLKQVFFSSRIWGRGTVCASSPEPYAYEEGYGVKWLIQAQIEQRRSGMVDPIAGDLSGPWIGWAAYIWANNGQMRSDGLTWNSADYSDSCHPNQTGWTKVGNMLMDFFLSSQYTPWFRN